MQSAYRQFYSTESALLKVTNDLLLAIDKGLEAILILLDFSSAFDTIDHTTMIHRFHDIYGFDGAVLQWLTSYLEDRTQIITLNRVQSEAFPLAWGVPQGSVMGPLDFILYTGPLSNVISSHQGVEHMMYADDTQLYVILKQSEIANGVIRLEQCISDVKVWACSNNLMLNGAKTEILHVTSAFRRSSELPDLVVEGIAVTPSKSSRDLGVIVDDTLSMKQHIQKTCKAAAFGIHRIGKLRKYLDRSSTERLVNAFVTSHIDYCNSLLIDLPVSQLIKLQRIQNASARLITRTRKQEHITPILRSLHWLPFPQRIHFKILLLTYKALHGLAPAYIKDLVSPKVPTSSIRLRSSTSAHLQLAHGPRTHTRYGNRAFSVCAPRLWNNLPLHVRDSPTLPIFKNRLKTYLFTQ